MSNEPNNSQQSAPFIKLDDAGNYLPFEATDWSQVFDPSTGLIWPRRYLPRDNWKDAISAASGFDLAGQTWRMPSPKELVSIVDYARFNPAINIDFFDCPSGGGWFWTSTPAPWSPSDFAMSVNFSYGYVYDNHQDYTAFVRPVRSARASQ